MIVPCSVPLLAALLVTSAAPSVPDLPKSFDASISAGTLNGDIHAIDGLDVDATNFTGSSMQGKIGKGGLKVDLNTVNGSIEIRREGEGGTRDKE